MTLATLPAVPKQLSPSNDLAQPDTPKAAPAPLPGSIGATTEDLSQDISFSTYSPDLDLTDPATGQITIPLPTITAIPSIRRSSVETPEASDDRVVSSSRRTAVTHSVITVNTFSESDSFLDTPTSSSAQNSDHALVGRSPTSDNQGHGHFLLPIPTRPANGSRTSLTVADVIDDSVTDPLLPEIAAADIYVAPDGSFVETSSAMAARELKKRYDMHFGVSIEARSPFALTSFVNQHGKQMIRLGHRQLSAPLASAPQMEERITQATASSSETSPRTRRRSRLSMHTFLPPTIFAKVPSSRPQTGTSQNGRSKLRKTRSISDMVSLSDSSLSPGTTGRVHSHSVTAADLPRYPSIHSQYPLTPTGDAFAEVMNWPSSTATASPSTSYSTHSVLPVNGTAGHSSVDHARAVIAEPFGMGVKFETPAQKLNFLPTPRLLRGVQSFESGRTAKQDDKRASVRLPSPPSLDGRASPALSEPIDISGDFTDAFDDLVTIPSIHIDTSSHTLESDLLPETLNFSHHTSEVFDILQKYRGLPLLDMLAADSKGTTVIKMSLSSEDNVSPRDDPRFVIWGELQQPFWDITSSRDSFTDRSSLPSSTMSRRRSAKAAKAKSPERMSIQSNADAPRLLLAATIERWIAQLTSDLNYDELLNFFLTYRTYIDPMELCHFLICRFHWALKMPSPGQDESVRRIVLVRTFVAIRYWLLTFFVVDFMPNRELRLFVAAWLNTLLRDPALKNHHEGLNMVQRLIKVAKDCKQVHTSLPTEPKPPRTKQPSEIQEDHVLGKKFAEATRKVPVEDNVSELDLDFLPEQVEAGDANSDPVNAHLNMAHVGSGISPTRPSSLPLSSFSILRRTEASPAPLTADNGITILPGISSPTQSNPISRAIVKTIGHIGRWRRVLNSRPVVRPPLALNACADLSAFDVDLTVGARDLLTVNGGVEQYLKMPPLPVAVTPMPPPPPPVPPLSPSPSPVPFEQDVAVPEAHTLPPLLQPLSHDTDHETETINEETTVEVAALTADNLESHDNDDPPLNSQLCDEGEVDEAKRLSHAESFRSSSTESFGALLTDDALRTFQPPVPQFDVVSIDDMEFSDTSSVAHVPTGDDEEEPVAPPGLRKPVRKLPTRRQFEFVRPETVSSMGIISRESIGSDPSSSLSVTSLSIGPDIQPWQLAALAKSFSNEEELGDVEAALRNLEGQIKPEEQQERNLQVDGWVRGIQQRMAIGDYSYSNAESEDEDEEDEFDRRQSSFYEPSDSASLCDLNVNEQDTLVTEEQSTAHTPQPSQTSHIILPSQESNLSPIDGKPAREDVVPLEILQSRLPTSTSTSPTTTANPIIDIPISLTSKFGNPEAPRIHRSFVLNYRAEELAKNFSVIDRELFIGVKFDELVVDDWMRCQEVNILDWAQFLKDRAQWKAESRFPEKTSALAAVRARFNLMVNFVISEIALTHPVERHAVAAKFIRVAWKSYDFQNFTTLVAIVKALQSEWINKLLGRLPWSRIGHFENRALNDLKIFISNADDFKFIRQQIDAVTEAKQIDTTSHASVASASGTTNSEHRPMAPPSCIPFIGIYLSRLYRLSQLPDLIDPTAPNKAVSIEPATANCDPPAHPEVFASLQPLPPFMHLEPLINVHKQRQIAAVIKSLVSGQHLAFDQHIELHDKKLFQKCLRLRGLDTPTLQRALSLYND